MRHNVFLITLMVVVESHAIKSSMVSMILDSLPEVCPYANICIANRTLKTPKNMSSLACCSECSCHSNCVDSNDCCFPTKLSQINTLSERQVVKQTEHSCLFPVTPLLPDMDMINYQSYKMVDHVSKLCVLDDESTRNASCGDLRVAPWGSLYPVYSNRTKKIYKNMICAVADGKSDAETWDAILVCDGYYKDTSNYVIGLDSNQMPYGCSVDFVYGGNATDLNPLKCFDDFINKCLLDDFNMPLDLEMSKMDITSMCESGFISPYKMANNYANVYCYICDGNFFAKDLRCEDSMNNKGRVWDFIGLLDKNFINKNNGPVQKIQYVEYPRVCSSVNTERCRFVLCPSGQLRDKFGVCRYPHKLWYDQSYNVFIKLTSNTYFNLTEIFKLNKEMSKNYLPIFKSPWPRNWFIHSIKSSREALNETVEQISLLVMLKTKTITVKPKEFIQALCKWTGKRWSLQLNGSTVVFTSNVAVYMSDEMWKTEDGYQFIHDRNRNQIVHYTTLYQRSRSQGFSRFITKLYFCEQVELTSDEIIFNQLEGTIFNKMTKRFYFDGEYAIVQSNAFEGIRVRICFEDSDITEEVLSSGVDYNFEMFYVWLFPTLLHCLY